MTQFQDALLSDKDAQWIIIRNMHKKFWDDKHKKHILNRIKVYTKYNWVILNGRIKDYGVIDLAISNDRNMCSGPGYTLEDFKRIRKQNRFSFHLWRMCLDKLYEKQEKDDLIIIDIIIDKLKAKGYESILATEYYEYYYN